MGGGDVLSSPVQNGGHGGPPSICDHLAETGDSDPGYTGICRRTLAVGFPPRFRPEMRSAIIRPTFVPRSFILRRPSESANGCVSGTVYRPLEVLLCDIPRNSEGVFSEIGLLLEAFKILSSSPRQIPQPLAASLRCRLSHHWFVLLSKQKIFAFDYLDLSSPTVGAPSANVYPNPPTVSRPTPALPVARYPTCLSSMPGVWLGWS